MVGYAGLLHTTAHGHAHAYGHGHGHGDAPAGSGTSPQVDGVLVHVDAVVTAGGVAAPGAQDLLSLLVAGQRPWAYVTTAPAADDATGDDSDDTTDDATDDTAADAALAVWAAGLPTGPVLALAGDSPAQVRAAARHLGVAPRGAAAVVRPGAFASAAVVAGLLPVLLPTTRRATAPGATWRERLADTLAQWQLRGLAHAYAQWRALEAPHEPVGDPA